MSDISLSSGSLVVDVERKQVTDTIAAVDQGNVSLDSGLLVTKKFASKLNENIKGAMGAMRAATIKEDGPISENPERQFYQSGVSIDQRFPPTAASGVQSTDGKVDYKDPTEIPLPPDSLEVTGLTGAQQILEKIAIGEGATVDKLNQQKQFGIGTSKYDMVYNYGKSLAPSKPVSTMTLSELYDFQTNLINATKGKVKGTTLGTSAVGKYQILRTSLFGSGTAENPMENSWAEKLGLKTDTVFSPELQEQIGMLALEEAGLKSFIQGTRNENQFQDRIANIWASVATSSGGDVYGQGVATFKKDLMPLFQKVKDQNRPDDFSDPVEVPEGRGEPIKPKIRPEQ